MVHARTHDKTRKIIRVLLHERIHLHEDVVSLLHGAWVGKHVMVDKCKRHTFAEVLLQVLNAFDAASIACLVSSNPISGTVPNSSSVAGSVRPIRYPPEYASSGGLTGDLDYPALLRVDPLPINEALCTDQ